MSKSYGNYIALNEKPEQMFGKIMSVPDALMGKYYTALTDLDMPKNMSPRDAKLKLAEEVVAFLHGTTKAQKAREEFIRVFSKKETPSEMPSVRISAGEIRAAELLISAGAVASKSEARRLIVQGGVKINRRVLKEPAEILNISDGDILRIGKKRFIRLFLKK
jgi:tyrosyl-tRNA synthetase